MSVVHSEFSLITSAGESQPSYVLNEQAPALLMLIAGLGRT
jgi:hypothetical protein